MISLGLDAFDLQMLISEETIEIIYICPCAKEVKPYNLFYFYQAVMLSNISDVNLISISLFDMNLKKGCITFYTTIAFCRITSAFFFCFFHFLREGCLLSFSNGVYLLLSCAREVC